VEGFSEDNFDSFNIFKKGKIFFNCIYSFEARKKLSKLIKKEKPDLAHIHGIFYQLSLSVIDVLKENKIPMVMNLNDYFTLCANGYLFRNGKVCELCKSGKHRSILFNNCYRESFMPSLMAYFVKKLQHYRKIFDSVDMFIVPTEDMKKLMMEWGIKEEKLRIIHNPLDAAQYKPSYEFADYIVFYGRFVRLKGIFTILKAMGIAKEIKLKMFGCGPDQKEMVEYISANKLDNIEIDSHLRWGEELIKIISKARFVITASEWFCPSDYVVYEAFSLGKPVVASEIGGNRYLVKDGFNGLLFTTGDADCLAQKIRKLYSQESLIAEMGKNARNFVESELNYDKFYEKIESLYREVIIKNK